ncbi:MAG: sodium-dependent transporter [Clostridia bacterium]|nr:sodium-dependent transporter [Clostridia bacterium]
MGKKRSGFTGGLGFVFATAGSAVGLGNLWRFPYLAAKYGGGIFLLCYIILAMTFGLALMITEIAIGRKTGKSAIEAYGALNKKWDFLGKISSVVPMIILPYYCVIGGWVIKYFFVFVTGQGHAAAGEGYFEGFISQATEPIVWLLIYIAFTAVVVMLGVEKGIEKFSKVLMPVLVVLSIGIAIYTVTLDGAGAGVKYYFMPDFSKFSVMTVLAALGQLFYSMSISMGILITYGSYMPKETSIEKSAHQIEIFDSGIAIIAGLMIVPSVFVFTGGDEAMLQKGAGLMFEMLPKIFDTIPLGNVIGVIFFLLVFFAALTSSISLMETVVSIIQDKFGLKRKTVCLIVVAGCILLALPSSLGYGIWDSVKIFGLSFLDFFDFVSNSVIMPIVAILTCIFVGYVIKPKTLIDEIAISKKFKSEKLYIVIIKYIAPFCILAILISSVLNSLGVIDI